MGKEIETLRQQGHTVYVLSFISQPFDEELYADHKGDEHYHAIRISKLTRLWHTLTEPWMPYYFAARTSLRFAVKMVRIINKYHIDAIHAEYAAMGQYLWIKKLYPHLRFTLVEHDMTAQSYERKVEQSSGWKKSFMQGQLSKILRKEGQYIKQADHVITFNEKDMRLIEEKYGRSDVRVINPYFGELDSLNKKETFYDKKKEKSLHNDSDKAVASDKIIEDSSLAEHIPGRICFLGQMGRPENHQAAMRLIRIIEEVRKKAMIDITLNQSEVKGSKGKLVKDIQLYIVGSHPLEELKAEESPYVHITGFVDDVDVYLRQSQLAVFPLEQGAGIKVKVLRAMAAGTPVVTGDIGAEGIDEDYEVLIHAESDEDYIEAITACLSGRIDTNTVGRASIDYAREHFDWSKSEQVLSQLY